MDTYALINENIQPVLLGNSRSARKTARKLFSKYGIISYICDSNRSPFSMFSPSSVSLITSSVQYPELLCEQLLNLGASDSSCIWLAVPCTEAYTIFIQKNKSTLECSYIISDPQDLPYSHPLLQGKDGNSPISQKADPSLQK